MKNPIMKIFVLIFVIGFFILPNIVSAELDLEEIIKNQDKVEFKKKNVKAIFKTLIQELEDEWIELPAAKEQAVLTILTKEIKVDALQYLLIESSKDLIEVTLKLAGLLLTQDPSIIIGEIEKITVNQAKGYAMDWLLQKEIKVAKGNLKFSYPAYIGGWEQGVFSYIIVYRPLDLKKGEVIIEIYSSRIIKTPDLIAGCQWEGGIDELPPFIVRIKGEVEKFDWVSYRWTKGPEIDIIFDEPVPDFEFKEPTAWDKIKSFINKLEVILDNVIDLGTGGFSEIIEKIEDVYNLTTSFFSNLGLNLFGASVAPVPQFFEPVLAPGGASAGKEELEEVEEMIKKIWTKTEVSLSEIDKDEIDIDKFQDILDDIAERIDILSQEISQLLVEQAFDGVGGPIGEEPASAPDGASVGEEEEEEEEEEDQPAASQPQAEKPKTRRRSGGGGGGSQTQPQIAFSYPENNPVNKEIEVALSLADFKSAIYDVKISIEKEGVVLSQIYSQKEDKWQSSYYYLKEAFFGPSFEGNFRLKIAEEKNDFRGEADIIVRVRESGKTNYSELINKINLIEPEPELEPLPAEAPPGAEEGEPEPEPGEQEEEEEEEEEEPSEEPSQIVIINEIAWMGTKAQANDEWIELYNPGSEEIELVDWQLIFTPLEGEPRIATFSMIDTTTPSIQASSYFLLERTSDETISDIEADYVFNLQYGLNNDGGILELRDANSNLIDKVDCSEDGWFAGDKDNKISMERINDSWASNNLIVRQGKDADDNKIWGTPKAENSINPPTEIFTSLPFDEFDEITLGIQSSPYIIRWTLDIPQGKTLNIEPGVVLKFYDKYSGLKVDGTLKANGTEDDKIIFTSFDISNPGNWGQIYFTETSTDSELDNIIVRYGGGKPPDPAGGSCSDRMAGIRVEQSSVLIKNSIIEHNMQRGIFLINSSSIIDNVQVSQTAICNKGEHNEFGGYGIVIRGGNPVIKNSSLENQVSGIYMREWPDSEDVIRPAKPSIEDNIFKQNQEAAIQVFSSSPFLSNNQAVGNNFNGVLISGLILESTNWQAGLPYIVQRTLTVLSDVVFTLEPGVIVKFYDKYSKIRVDGSLKAIGTEGNKIIFTSFKDEPRPGDWDQIYFSPSSFDSELVNVIIRYGGGRYIAMASCPWEATGIKIDQSAVLIKDSIIEHNKHIGLWLINSDSIIDNVHIADTSQCLGIYAHGGIGIQIDNGSPVLNNLTFEANTCNIFQNKECINPAP